MTPQQHHIRPPTLAAIHCGVIPSPSQTRPGLVPYQSRGATMSPSTMSKSGRNSDNVFHSIQFPVPNIARGVPKHPAVMDAVVQMKSATCAIADGRLRKTIVTHIRGKQFSEPWPVLIPPESLCRKLVEPSENISHGELHTELAQLLITELAEAVESLIAVSFFYQKLSGNTSGQHPERWMLISPAGAMFVVQWQQTGKSAELFLVSCYFHRACNLNASAWKHDQTDISFARTHYRQMTALFQVHRYWPNGYEWSNEVEIPDEHEIDRLMTLAEYAVNIKNQSGQLIERHIAPQFWTRESWGFSGDGFWSKAKFEDGQSHLRSSQRQRFHTEKRTNNVASADDAATSQEKLR